MLSCSDCRNLLLDDLYGLLDNFESATLRAHLAGCPTCQAEQTAAAQQQRLLAKAARVYAEVPAFQAPAAAGSPEPVTTTPQPAPAPASLPMPNRSRRVLRC